MTKVEKKRHLVFVYNYLITKLCVNSSLELVIGRYGL
jgi:hypothetical protein